MEGVTAEGLAIGFWAIAESAGFVAVEFWVLLYELELCGDL